MSSAPGPGQQQELRSDCRSMPGRPPPLVSVDWGNTSRLAFRAPRCDMRRRARCRPIVEPAGRKTPRKEAQTHRIPRVSPFSLRKAGVESMGCPARCDVPAGSACRTIAQLNDAKAQIKRGRSPAVMWRMFMERRFFAKPCALPLVLARLAMRSASRQAQARWTLTTLRSSCPRAGGSPMSRRCCGPLRW